MARYILKPILDVSNNRWLRFSFAEGGQLQKVEANTYDPTAETIDDSSWEELPDDLDQAQVFSGFDFSINQRVCYCWGPAADDVPGVFYRLRYQSLTQQPLRHYESFMQLPGSHWQFQEDSASVTASTVHVNSHQFEYVFLGDDQLPSDDAGCHNQVRGLDMVSQSSWCGDMDSHFADLQSRIVRQYEVEEKELLLTEQQQISVLDNFRHKLAELLRESTSKENYIQALIAALSGDFSELEGSSEQKAEEQELSQQLAVANAARHLSDSFMPVQINMHTPEDATGQASVGSVHEYLCEALLCELASLGYEVANISQRGLQSGYNEIAVGKKLELNATQLDLLVRMVASAITEVMDAGEVDIGIKALYLKRAVRADHADDYYGLLSKLYATHDNLELIKALKLIHDLCFNNVVRMGETGSKEILRWHFYPLGSINPQAFQSAVRDMVFHRMREIASTQREVAERQSEEREALEHNIAENDAWQQLIIDEQSEDEEDPDDQIQFDQLRENLDLILGCIKSLNASQADNYDREAHAKILSFRHLQNGIERILAHGLIAWAVIFNTVFEERFEDAVWFFRHESLQNIPVFDTVNELLTVFYGLLDNQASALRLKAFGIRFATLLKLNVVEQTNVFRNVICIGYIKTVVQHKEDLPEILNNAMSLSAITRALSTTERTRPAALVPGYSAFIQMLKNDSAKLAQISKNVDDVFGFLVLQESCPSLTLDALARLTELAFPLSTLKNHPNAVSELLAMSDEVLQSITPEVRSEFLRYARPYRLLMTAFGVGLTQVRAIESTILTLLVTHCDAVVALAQEGLLTIDSAASFLTLPALGEMLTHAKELIFLANNKAEALYILSMDKKAKTKLYKNLQIVENLVEKLGIPLANIVALPEDTLIAVLTDPRSDAAQEFLRPYVCYPPELIARINTYVVDSQEAKAGSRIRSPISTTGLFSRQQRFEAYAAMRATVEHSQSAEVLRNYPAVHADGLRDIYEELKTESDAADARIAGCYV